MQTPTESVGTQDPNAAVEAPTSPTGSSGTKTAETTGNQETESIPLPRLSKSPRPTGSNGQLTGNDHLLMGPTDRPREHVTAGSGLYAKRPVPENISEWLPALTEAAQDPTAPAMFKNMLQLLMYHVNEGS